jgi:hypothetical protein
VLIGMMALIMYLLQAALEVSTTIVGSVLVLGAVQQVFQSLTVIFLRVVSFVLLLLYIDFLVMNSVSTHAIVCWFYSCTAMILMKMRRWLLA